jgi:hypothetical protein
VSRLRSERRQGEGRWCAGDCLAQCPALSQSPATADAGSVHIPLAPTWGVWGQLESGMTTGLRTVVNRWSIFNVR